MAQTETETIQTPFQKGLALYEQKAPIDEIIPIFEDGFKQTPKDSTGPTCLAWLYMMRDQEGDRKKALDYAQMAVRMDFRNYQAQFNLVLAMLMNEMTGIRPEVDKARQKINVPEELEEVVANLKDAVERKPEFKEAQKLLNWLA